MIQRKQSVFLLIAIVCNLLLFIFPVFKWTPLTVDTNGTPGYTLSVLETIDTQTGKQTYLNRPLIIADTMIIILSFAVIFMYKNRVKQAKICNLLMILQLILGGLIIYDWNMVSKLAGNSFTWMPQGGVLFFVLALLLFWLSRRFILKDEALVRSADRLR
jgi:hypothetical protein